ncbi:MAG: 7-carboxy-7-deazaguanine synthase QueE [bacterium]|nr:7-carboxy-7-deazaguanine synthase QueE [bacterium]MDD5756903.1 7-carboxy-7-deazaguanine synthase QueE [bacterium]
MTDSRWQLKPNSKALITEIFASIQGEGLYVGERQIFVRFVACNLKCDYCDTKTNKRIRELAGERVLNEIKDLNKGKIHSVSVTGGEPLLYADFLQALIPQINRLGLKTYLETNGTLPQELRKVIRLVNYVAMDIKMPSSGNPACWDEHREFLEILNRSHIHPGDFFVKIVLTSKTRAAEIKKATGIIARVSKHIPLILQPVSPIRQVRAMVPKNIFAFQSLALEHLSIVKVIPQMHKILGVR